MDTKYRHEWKHVINAADRIIIRQRLRAVARPDDHAVDGIYRIRSLYFDDLKDSAGLIHLEKKCKTHDLSRKFSAPLTADEAQAIVDGSIGWMKDCGRPLVQELYAKMRSRCLRPKTVVDYTREPFTYRPGNVRVTIDYDIRTGLYETDFLNPDCIMIPAADSPIILEVKWDEFLPDIIRDAVNLKGRRAAAFSKYAACRIYE